MANNGILDNALFQLATELKSTDLTVDIYAVNADWDLTDDKLSAILQKFKLKVVSKDSQSTFESMRITSVVENGTIFGFNRYTLTLATATDGANPTMRGLANNDSGSNIVANRIASRIVATFPPDSPCGIFVGNAEYQELKDLFDAGSTTQSSIYGETIAALLPYMVSTVDKKIYIYDGTYPLKGITIESGVADDVKTVGTWGYLSAGHSAWDGSKKVYADSATGDWTQTSSATTVLAGSPEIPSGGSDFTSLRLAFASDASVIASKVEAEAGVENTKTMTSLRTKEAIIAQAGVNSIEYLENLTAGDIVRIVDDGGTAKVRQVVDNGVGTRVQIEAAKYQFTSIAYDPVLDVFLVVYYDLTNTQLEAVACTISGTVPTFGTPHVLDTNTINDLDVVYDAGAGKFLVAYGDNIDDLGEAVVVSATAGRVVTSGSTSTFNAAQTTPISIAYDANAGKTLICYRDDGGDDFGHTKVATISGVGVSFGDEDDFTAAATTVIVASYDEAAEKTLITFTETTTQAIVATISGTDTTFGSAVSIAGLAMNGRGMAYDSLNNKHLLVGTIGSAAVIHTLSVSSTVPTWETLGCIIGDMISPYIDVAYDSIQNKFIVAYVDDQASDFGYFSDVSLSNGGIKVGEQTAFEGAVAPTYIAVACNNLATNNKSLIVYMDNANTKSYGIVAELESRDSAVGVAQITANAATTNNVKLWGGISAVHSALTMGIPYYISAAGEATILQTGFPLGLSTSATQILTNKSDEPRITQGFFDSAKQTDNVIHHGLGKMPRRIMIVPQGNIDVGAASDAACVTCIGTPGNLSNIYTYLDTADTSLESETSGFIHNANETTFSFFTGATDENHRIFWTAEA